MIKTTYLIYLVIFFFMTSCSDAHSSFDFNGCMIQVPTDFEKVKNSTSKLEFYRKKDGEISIIQLRGIGFDFSELKGSSDLILVKSFQLNGTGFFVFDLIVGDGMYKIRSLVIDDGKSSLIMQSLSYPEVEYILGHCVVHDTLIKIKEVL